MSLILCFVYDVQIDSCSISFIINVIMIITDLHCFEEVYCSLCVFK